MIQPITGVPLSQPKGVAACVPVKFPFLLANILHQVRKSLQVFDFVVTC